MSMGKKKGINQKATRMGGTYPFWMLCVTTLTIPNALVSIMLFGLNNRNICESDKSKEISDIKASRPLGSSPIHNHSLDFVLDSFRNMSYFNHHNKKRTHCRMLFRMTAFNAPIEAPLEKQISKKDKKPKGGFTWWKRVALFVGMEFFLLLMLTREIISHPLYKKGYLPSAQIPG